jgi:predicted transcriptional regulator
LPKEIILGIHDRQKLFVSAKAMASESRLEIINLLNRGSYNINEIAERLDMPVSTAAMHVKVLEDADLIRTELQPGIRGSMKLCSRKIDVVHINLANPENNLSNLFEINMPIGNYVDCKIQPTCGLASEKSFIDTDDSPRAFYNPLRTEAQILWLGNGYVEYRFPNSILLHANPLSMELSMEICSEAPNYRNNWPSDITLWINGTAVGTWRSPGDLGGRRGRLNPTWWPDASTQHGLLKTWKVNADGSFIDEARVSDVTIDQLDLKDNDYITVRIGIAEDAENVGGITIFGEKYGDYEQNILMRLDYTTNFNGEEKTGQ